MKASRVALWATTVVGGLALVSPGLAEADSTPVLGETAPAFSLRDCQGKEVKLSSFDGKVVVLEWINQKCPYSKAKHSDKTMQKTAGEFAGKDVVWLGIDSSHYADAQANKEYAKEMGITYKILQDSDGKTGKAYGTRTTPHMFVIGKDGKVAYSGAIDNAPPGQDVEIVRNYVAEAVESLLKGTTVEVTTTKPYGCSVKYAPK